MPLDLVKFPSYTPFMNESEIDNSRLLVIELNEFNNELLKTAAQEFNLKNIQRILSFNKINLATKDTYESDFLEPWVQWVSIHTGQESNRHKIKHLGDVPNCDFPQIWEILSKQGISTGVWGVLNGNRGVADHCKFFLPDPWTFSERAFPAELNSLLDFPRYVATHRSDLSVLALLKTFFPFILKLFSFPILGKAIKNFPKVIRKMVSNPTEAYVGYCYVEYLSALLFLRNWEKKQPQVGFVFLNMLAHVQHYHWVNEDVQNNTKLKYCLEFIDSFLGEVFNFRSQSDKILVLNGLSQKNTNQDSPWIGYRAYSFGDFLALAGIKFDRVESLMSYDAHIFFKTGSDRLVAENILKQATIGEKQLLLVESYDEEPNKLFFRPQFYDPVTSDTTFSINGKEIKFLDVFKPLGVRTGKHIPAGTAYTDLINSPDKIENHQVFNVILNHFSMKQIEKTAHV